MLIAQSYAPMWALVACMIVLGMLSVAVPRFRRTELVPPDRKKDKKKPRKK